MGNKIFIITAEKTPDIPDPFPVDGMRILPSACACQKKKIS